MNNKSCPECGMRNVAINIERDDDGIIIWTHFFCTDCNYDWFKDGEGEDYKETI